MGHRTVCMGKFCTGCGDSSVISEHRPQWPPMETLQAAVKIRDGKKWKKRFCTLQNPAANTGTFAAFVLLEIYKDAKLVNKSGQKRRVIRIEGFHGLESGFSLDKESRTLAVLSQSFTAIFAFDSDPALRNWELWFSRVFGRECQYLVYVADAPSSLIEIRYTNARLHLRDGGFCLAVDTPPRVALGLSFRDIRRYGAYDNKFCVEAGSRTGHFAGVYIFRTGHRDQLSFMFRLASENGLHKYLSCDSDGGTKVPNGSVPTETQASSSLNIHVFRESRSSSAICKDQGSRGHSIAERGRAVSTGAAYANDNFDNSCDMSGSFRKAGSGYDDASCTGNATDPNVALETVAKGRKMPMFLHLNSSPSDFPTRCDISKEQSPSEYQNTDHLGRAISVDQNSDFTMSSGSCGKETEAPENGGDGGESVTSTIPGPLPGYMAMRPGPTGAYERMDHSVTNVESENIEDDSDTWDGSYVKGFEPLILQRAQSRTLPLSSTAHHNWKADRKFSLPASFASTRRIYDSQYSRRLSLEEGRSSLSPSPVSVSEYGMGHKRKTMFKSTSAMARNLIQSSSTKAASIFVSLTQRSLKRNYWNTSQNSTSEDQTDEGRHSRAYSEPPMRTRAEFGSRQSRILQEPNFGSETSSLDLDEVQYDVSSSLMPTPRLPHSVLSKIGIKPLVPTVGDLSPSIVKLPLGPKSSYGTESTRSGESMDPLTPGPFSVYDHGPFDAGLFGSDDTYSDKKSRQNTARYEEESGKPTQKPPPVITLTPRKMSLSARRRLREEVTKPLTGSYSRYDSAASGESPTLSRANVPSMTRTTVESRHHPPSRKTSQNQEIFKEHNVNFRERKTRPSVDKLAFSSPPGRTTTTHSPPPPIEHAPSPPDEDRARIQSFRQKLPLSALPRLEGHIFRFPPTPALNYAMLAGQARTGTEREPARMGAEKEPTGTGAEREPVRPSKTTQYVTKEDEGSSVEYARIDQAATQAARKVVTSRQEETRDHWASHSLSIESPQKGQSMITQISSKCGRSFSFKKSFMRSRTSMTNLSGF